MSNDRGMILLTTLVLMICIAGMVLTMMRTVVLLKKTQQQYKTTREIEIRLEEAARVMLKNSQRYFSILNPTKQGHFNFKSHGYHYEILDLGVASTLCISEPDQTFASHHWRLELRDDNSPERILQLRIAKVERSMRCEKQESILILPGILSWRMIEKLV